MRKINKRKNSGKLEWKKLERRNNITNENSVTTDAAKIRIAMKMWTTFVNKFGKLGKTSISEDNKIIKADTEG